MKRLPSTAQANSSRRAHLIACAFIFLLAFGVRLLAWHDTRFEVGKVQTSVAESYQHVAELFRQEGVRGFFSSASPLADLNYLGHPPPVIPFSSRSCEAYSVIRIPRSNSRRLFSTAWLLS